MEKNTKNDPAYVEVYRRLKAEIENGTYPVGTFLPRENELEAMFGVSRTTIRKAVKLLRQEGKLEVRQGCGTMVRDYRAKQDYTRVTSVTESLQKKGYHVSVGSMMIDIIEASGRLSEELELPAGTKVARVQRL